VFDGKTKCKTRFPPSLNLARAVLEDLEEANSTDSDIIQTCRDTIDKPIAHSTANKLGVAMVSFIVATIFLNIVSLVVAVATDEPFGPACTGILGTDALFIFTSLVLCIAMMNYEGGGYLKGVHGGEYSDKAMMGIATWMLVAMLIGRVLSNPWLVLGAILILLPIALVFVLFLVRTRGLLSVVRVVVAAR
jgi:hypothetical protein